MHRTFICKGWDTLHLSLLNGGSEEAIKGSPPFFYIFCVYETMVVAKCGGKMGLTTFLRNVCVHQKLKWMFLKSTKLNIFLIPNGVKSSFVYVCQKMQHLFITVLCKIFMQICNLFLYHVLWLCVKVLNRTVFTVIIYVNYHLLGYLNISSCNYVVHNKSLNRWSYLYFLNAVLLAVCRTARCDTVSVTSDLVFNTMQNVTEAITL